MVTLTSASRIVTGKQLTEGVIVLNVNSSADSPLQKQNKYDEITWILM